MGAALPESRARTPARGMLGVIMKIALAQINPTVGDLSGNRRLAQEAAERAASAGADCVVLPELALTGYPPMDLLERDRFVDDQLAELDELARQGPSLGIA